MTTGSLARECALPADSLECLASAAAELKLLRRHGDDRWGLGELGAASRGSPGIEAMVRHHELLYRDLADPLDLLRNRSEASLRDYWTYAARPGHSSGDAAAQYSELMARSQSFVADDVLSHGAFERCHTLLDVGGGSGFFAAEAMRRYPHLRVTVFDLPSVAALAGQRFVDEGLAERGSSVGGSVFDDELPPGFDAVSLVRVLHDHDDEAAYSILRAVRRALPSDGRLFVAEPMAETAQARGVGAYFHLYLWAMGSGKPRSRARLQHMLEEVGFADVREHRTYQPMQVRLLSARPGSAANDTDTDNVYKT